METFYEVQESLKKVNKLIQLLIKEMDTIFLILDGVLNFVFSKVFICHKSDIENKYNDWYNYSVL